MHAHSKTTYHPYFLIAFYLQCLPSEWVECIPRSTRHDWRQKKEAGLCGYDWYQQHRAMFTTSQQIASHGRLLKVNRALLRIIALRNFVATHSRRIKGNAFGINAVVLSNLEKISRVFGSRMAVKYIGQSYSWYIQLRHKKCPVSLLQLCRVRHPFQLLHREINGIRRYCLDPRFLQWPLASVYHQMRRDGLAHFAIPTFYKYANLLNLRRSLPIKRRKHHATGIRATAPLQILHADTTVFRTVDRCKHYIYLVQDNFSRTILCRRLANTRSANFTFDNLQQVHRQFLSPSNLHQCQVIMDDGSENKGPVLQWASTAYSPAIRLLTAQVDVEFSNSMIEAANKQLKYRFLYCHDIPNAAALADYLDRAIDDYNNRPHHVLGGLTPMEVLNGKQIDQSLIQHSSAQARLARIAENKAAQCCHYSF